MPIKAGLYEVSFSAMLWNLGGPTPANYICGVLDSDTFLTAKQAIYTADSAAYFGSSPAAVSGAATVRIKHGTTPGAVCFADAGTFQFFRPLRVTFTRINSLDTRTAKPEPLPMGAKKWIQR